MTPNSRSCHSTCWGEGLISVKFWICEFSIVTLKANDAVSTKANLRQKIIEIFTRVLRESNPDERWASLIAPLRHGGSRSIQLRGGAGLCPPPPPRVDIVALLSHPWRYCCCGAAWSSTPTP